MPSPYRLKTPRNNVISLIVMLETGGVRLSLRLVLERWGVAIVVSLRVGGLHLAEHV